MTALYEAAQKAYPNGEPNWLPTCQESKKLHDAETAFIHSALAQQGEQPAMELQELADRIDPFTRKFAPDHLTMMVAAKALRGAAPAPQPDTRTVVQQMVGALDSATAWDKGRKFIIPYKVRDPMHAAIQAGQKWLEVNK